MFFNALKHLPKAFMSRRSICISTWQRTAILQPALVRNAAPILTAHQDNKFIIITNQEKSSTSTASDTNIFEKLPIIWLRENCQCAECFHRASHSRILDWTRFDINVQPEHIFFDNATASLHVRWSDHHSTSHPLSWLRQHTFNPTAQAEYRRSGIRPARQPWTASTFAAVAQHQRFQYAEIINSAAGLRAWLRHMAVHGVAFIRNAGRSEEAVRRLAERVAFIRPMHYGTRQFQVRDKAVDTAGGNNLSYLAVPLQLHTDLPYYQHIPGVNMLHCIRQTRAAGQAANLLVDGLTVAARMRAEWPEHYERLRRIAVDWQDVGEDEGFRFDKRLRAPVIEVDAEGEVQGVRFSVPQRDARFTCDVDEVDGWYRAHAKMMELMYEEAVRFKTQPGDVLTFDNVRLVHGRTAFADVRGVERHLEGAFVDWDEMYSRLRVLEADERGEGDGW